MRTSFWAAALLCAVVGGGAVGGAAWAHSAASGVVKQRMDAMSDIGRQMKAIGKMMNGDAAFDPAVLQRAARAIESHAQNIPTLFPEGSDQKPTEALPIVWTDWEKFRAIAQALAVSADRLAISAPGAGSAADIRADFSALGTNCQSCHQTFRKPKH